MLMLLFPAVLLGSPFVSSFSRCGQARLIFHRRRCLSTRKGVSKSPNMSANNDQERSRPNHILVVGSANQDLISYTNFLPQLGETVLGSGFQTSFGGKGANQAVAAASLDFSPVTMVCKVGSDSFGSEILRNFRKFQRYCNTVTFIFVLVIQPISFGTDKVFIYPNTKCRKSWSKFRYSFHSY